MMAGFFSFSIWQTFVSMSCGVFLTIFYKRNDCIRYYIWQKCRVNMILSESLLCIRIQAVSMWTSLFLICGIYAEDNTLWETLIFGDILNSQAVGEMTAEQQNVLLFFWTSIKYLPVEGFSGLSSRLYIYKTSESSDRLPSSHTCFYRLCLPAYPTSDVMHGRLNIITQEHVGCSFGTWWKYVIVQII